MDHAAPKPPRAAIAPADAARCFLPYMLGFLGLVGTLSGCSVWHQARRTLILEPRQFALGPENAAAFRKYRRWAHEALGEVAAADPEAIPSPYYEEGFVEGFTDFVFAGGDGQVPPLPPRRFWRLQFRNADGEKAIADWTAGFRHGARTAQEGGYRNRAVVPPTHLLVGEGPGYRADPTSEIWEPLREVPLELSPPSSGAAGTPFEGPTLAEPIPPGPAFAQPPGSASESLDSPVPPANLQPPFQPSPAEPPPAPNPAPAQLPALDELPALDDLPPAEGTAPAGQPAPPEESLFPDIPVEPSGGLQLNGPARRVSHARQPAIDTSVAPATYFEPATDPAAKPTGADPFLELETTTNATALTLTVSPETTATSATTQTNANSDQPQPPAELRLLDAITISPLPVPSYPDTANLNRWERLFVAGDHAQESEPSGEQIREAAVTKPDNAGNAVPDTTQQQTGSPIREDGPRLQPATGDPILPDNSAALIITSPITSPVAANWQPAKNSWQPVEPPSAANRSKRPPRKDADTRHDLGKPDAVEEAASQDTRDEESRRPRHADDDPFLDPFGDK